MNIFLQINVASNVWKCFWLGAGAWNLAVTVSWKSLTKDRAPEITDKSWMQYGIGAFGIVYCTIGIKPYFIDSRIILLAASIKTYLFFDNLIDVFLKKTRKADLITAIVFGDFLWACGFVYAYKYIL